MTWGERIFGVFFLGRGGEVAISLIKDVGSSIRRGKGRVEREKRLQGRDYLGGGGVL